MVTLPDGLNPRVSAVPPTITIGDGGPVPVAAKVPPLPSAAPAPVPVPASRPAATKSAPPANSPGPSPRSAGSSGRTHTVQARETLYKISRQYGVRPEDLARANGITNPSNVPVGTVLRIP
jgi:LysM repeat protein